MLKDKGIRCATPMFKSKESGSRILSDILSLGCEWSDGKVEIEGYREKSIVQFSKEKNCYVWHDECEESVKLPCREVIAAYRQFEENNGLDDRTRLLLLWEIIHTFNDEYRRNSENVNIPTEEAKVFVDTVLAMQKYDNTLVPISIKAELFREAGMFKKCFDFDENNQKSEDEREIISEIHIRAARGDSRPFIIEDMSFYENRKRDTKRCCFEKLFC